jgi:hypothetical protein
MCPEAAWILWSIEKFLPLPGIELRLSGPYGIPIQTEFFEFFFF